MAWEVFPFPCIGEFWFLSFGLSAHPYYQQILERLKTDPSERLLDLGCCLGQDLRRLAYDGAPIQCLYGSDLFAGYEDAGYTLFRDKKDFSEHYITADIFDESSDSALEKTAGTWTVISIFMFLHTMNLDDAVRACKRMLHLLSKKNDSCIIGTQTGSMTPKEFPLGPPFVEKVGDRTVYRHSLETFIEMWRKVETETGVKLDVWAEYQTQDETGSHGGGGKTMFGGEDNRRIHFVIKRAS